MGTTAAPRLRVAAAKVDEKLLFPLAVDNADAGWVIPVLSRKIVVVASATAVARHPYLDWFTALSGRLPRCKLFKRREPGDRSRATWIHIAKP